MSGVPRAEANNDAHRSRGIGVRPCDPRHGRECDGDCREHSRTCGGEVSQPSSENSREQLVSASTIEIQFYPILLALITIRRHFVFFAMTDSANSIKRRIASEREGLSFCCSAQPSIADLSAGGSRTVRTGSRRWPAVPAFSVLPFQLTVLPCFGNTIICEPMGAGTSHRP